MKAYIIAVTDSSEFLAETTYIVTDGTTVYGTYNYYAAANRKRNEINGGTWWQVN